MSRIGKIPIVIPQGVEVVIDGQKVVIKGPKGLLSRELHHLIMITHEKNILRIGSRESSQKCRALWGLSRTLINNMVIGVSIGFTKVMEIIGVGYRAELVGSSLKMFLGFSHPVIFNLSEGISCTVEKNTILKLAGIDKELLGQTCAKIRGKRPPEPYKGKGIKFLNEVIRRKVGKSGVK